tara:strand:- start:711 stop:2033 length:1323 start_codon:yes stop_codon:yes gene_type:complete
MDNLNEQIDLVLAESLLEYTDVRDFRVVEPTISRLEKGSLKDGLDKDVSKEIVGLFRLIAVARLNGTPVTPIGLYRQLCPDFLINLPIKIEVMEQMFENYLNKEGDTFKVPESVLSPRTDGRPTGVVLDYEGYKSKIVNLAKFINGTASLKIGEKEYDLDFKKYVKAFWKGREEAIQDYIKRSTKAYVKVLSENSITDAEVFPSEIAKNIKYSNFYKNKLVLFINKNQRKVDDIVKKMIEDYDKTIEQYLKFYKKDNNQEDKTYGYSPPVSTGFENSKKSWERFVAYKLKLGSIIQKAIDDTVSSPPAPALPPGDYRTLSMDAGAPISESVIKEDKLATITIDLNELKKQKLDESFLAMFGGWVEQILGAMFGGKTLPLVVKGSQRDVESFANTIRGEKSYLDAVKRYGLDHPTTYRNKANLSNAIKGFERETGLQWPFK